MIDSGVERKAIKMSLRTVSIYVNKSIFGRIVNLKFQRQDSSIPDPSTSPPAMSLPASSPLASDPSGEAVPRSNSPSSVPSRVETDAQESNEGDSV